jgi:hypothetical protein
VKTTLILDLKLMQVEEPHHLLDLREQVLGFVVRL